MKFSLQSHSNKRWPHWIGTVLILSSILQCKEDPKTSIRTKVNGSSNACGSLTTDVVKNSFGLVPTPIDATHLTLEDPLLVTMAYTPTQSTLLVAFNPKDPTASRPDEYPDYATYKITDDQNEVCAEGQTGPSLYQEIYLPSSCKSATLTLTAQGCTSSPTNKDVPCGPSLSTKFDHSVNTATALGDSLSQIQEIRKKLGLVAEYLSAKSEDFLKEIGSKPSNVTTEQQLQISLAQKFIQGERDFADIFSSDVYDDLLALTQNEIDSNSGQTGLYLADSASCSASLAAGTDTTLADSTVANIDPAAILASARANYGASSSSTTVSSATTTNTASGSVTTQSGDFANDAVQVQSKTTDGVAIAIGASLIGVSISYAILFGAMKYADSKNNNKIQERWKAKRTSLADTLFEKLSPDPKNVIDLEGLKAKIRGQKKLVNLTSPDQIEWVKTADGKKYVAVFNNQAIVEYTDSRGTKKLELQKLKTSAFVDATKPTDGSPRQLKEDITGKNIKQVAVKAKTNVSSVMKNIMHGAAIGSIFTVGASILVMGANGQYLAAATGDAYQRFRDAIQNSETTINQLRTQLTNLEKQQTQQVLDEVVTP